MPASESQWLWAVPPPRAELGSSEPPGAVLRRYRQRAGLTQEQAAATLHIDQSYLSKIESGRRSIHDLDLLLRFAVMLDIPPHELGLSDDLLRSTASRDGSTVPGPAVIAAGESHPHITTSQDQWRNVRSYLNRHRAELGRHVIDLYPSGNTIGSTPLISRRSWLPDAPVDLAAVQLDWRAGPVPTRIRGIEPEALRLLPLCRPGQQYETYTSAIRYLSPPTLFENRPSYRLLDVTWTGATGRMAFGLATYFDKLDLSEAVGHEYAAATMASASAPTLGDLPFRALVGEPFDASRHAIIPAVTTLTIRIDGGVPSFLLHWRDPAKVATAGGMYDVIPAGEFQPSSVMSWDQANDFDLWRNIVRELSEELLGAPEHDGSRSVARQNLWHRGFEALTPRS